MDVSMGQTMFETNVVLDLNTTILFAPTFLGDKEKGHCWALIMLKKEKKEILICTSSNTMKTKASIL